MTRTETHVEGPNERDTSHKEGSRNAKCKSFLLDSLHGVDKLETHGDWARLQGSEFSLRKGPDYKKNGYKSPSLESLYDMVAIEIFRTENRIHHISKFLDWDRITAQCSESEDGVARDLCSQTNIPRYMILHFLLPLEDDGFLWKSNHLDHKNCSLVLMSSISPGSIDLLRKYSDDKEGEEFACIRLLQKFFQLEKDNPILKRFKGVAEIVDMEKYGFNSFIKPILHRYNAKPFVIRNTSSFYKGDTIPYLEVDIDVHEFNSIAKRVFSGLRDFIPDLNLNFAWTIEGREDDELPERTISACTVKNLNVKECQHMEHATPLL